MDITINYYCPTTACQPISLIDLTPSSGNCACVPVTGRIGEFILLACNAEGATPGQAPTETELTSVANWQTWVTQGKVRSGGKGIGSLSTTGTDTDDLGGCNGLPTVTSNIHEFTFQKKCINIVGLTANDLEFSNQVARGALQKYNMYLRLCDDTEVMFLMGIVNVTSNGNLVIPAGRNENAYIEYKFEKRKLGSLLAIKIPGLNSVLPAQA